MVLIFFIIIWYFRSFKTVPLKPKVTKCSVNQFYIIFFQNTRFKNEKNNILSSKYSHKAKLKKLTYIYVSIARAFSINVKTGRELPSNCINKKNFMVSCEMLVQMVRMEI